jgi:hypothetical protein
VNTWVTVDGGVVLRKCLDHKGCEDFEGLREAVQWNKGALGIYANKLEVEVCGRDFTALLQSLLQRMLWSGAAPNNSAWARQNLSPAVQGVPTSHLPAADQRSSPKAATNQSLLRLHRPPRPCPCLHCPSICLLSCSRFLDVLSLPVAAQIQALNSSAAASIRLQTPTMTDELTPPRKSVELEDPGAHELGMVKALSMSTRNYIANPSSRV